MRTITPILIIFFCCSDLDAQTTSSQDTLLYNFRLHPGTDIGFPREFEGMHVTGVKKYQVISSNYKTKTQYIFIDTTKNNFTSASFKEILTVKGYVSSRKERVFGVYSSFWEETTLYLTPVFITVD